MSQVMTTPKLSEHAELERLCVSIRGKLQFMDYLVRAALADIDRYQDESDAGTRIFIRQLIEMHASNLASERESMQSVSEFCGQIEALLNAPGQGHSDGVES